MRRDQIEKLQHLENIFNQQVYLLNTPKSAQQGYLHILAHRILINNKMIHKNIAKVIGRLQGTFAQSHLRITYILACIHNKVDLTETKDQIINMLSTWAPIYSSVRNKSPSKYLLKNMILPKEGRTAGFINYLIYLNTISVDIWKIFKNSNSAAEFYSNNPIKIDLKQWQKVSQNFFDPYDLLNFIQGCVPRTMSNVILEPDSMPPALTINIKQMECLYSNKAIQFYLRTSTQLSILLKNIFLILLTMVLSRSHQKSLIGLSMRYYLVYHHDRRCCAPQILIYSFQKVGEDIHQSFEGEFYHFFKILNKLGKSKFITYLSNNSNLVRWVIERSNQSKVGYSKQSFSPFNCQDIFDKIEIEKRQKVERYFEIFQDYSLLYFRVETVSLDINVNIYYLGGITSSKQQRILHYKLQKIKKIEKICLHSMKKGLYLIEFDNSKSWIHNKIVQNEYQAFTPLQLRQTSRYLWIQSVYDKVKLNKIVDDNNIKQYTTEYEEMKQNQNSLCLIQKNNQYFVLKVNHLKEQYFYQTDSLNLFFSKIKNMFDSKQKYQWKIPSKNNCNFKEIEQFLNQQLNNQSSQRQISLTETSQLVYNQDKQQQS